MEVSILKIGEVLVVKSLFYTMEVSRKVKQILWILEGLSVQCPLNMIEVKLH